MASEMQMLDGKPANGGGRDAGTGRGRSNDAPDDFDHGAPGGNKGRGEFDDDIPF